MSYTTESTSMSGAEFERCGARSGGVSYEVASVGMVVGSLQVGERAVGVICGGAQGFERLESVRDGGVEGSARWWEV